MEGEGKGGFHGSRGPWKPSSGMKAPGNSMVGLPTEMTQTINNNSSGNDNACIVREQDCFMPIANVVRIMRKILPPHAKISDDAKETIQECVSEFISFVTGEANERCQLEQRKTITAEDVLFAMNKLGFDDYVEPLTRYLQHYREYDGGERGSLMMNRAADPMNYGMENFPPGFVAHHPGFFGPAPLDGFLKDPSAAMPSQVDEANLELICPEQSNGKRRKA